MNGRFQCLFVYVWHIQCVRAVFFITSMLTLLLVFFFPDFIFVLLKFIQVQRNDPTNVSMQIILNWWTVMIPAFQWLDWVLIVSDSSINCCMCVSARLNSRRLLYFSKKIVLCLLRFSCNWHDCMDSRIKQNLLLVRFIYKWMYP